MSAGNSERVPGDASENAGAESIGGASKQSRGIESRTAEFVISISNCASGLIGQHHE